MERGFVTLIGMSIAYVASFLGLGLAWAMMTCGTAMWTIGGWQP